MKTNEEKIREACIRANPDILKLEFGCFIMVTLPRGKVLTVIIRESEDGSVELDYCPLIFTKTQLQHDKKFEIIGRSIRLTDVLLAVETKWCDWKFVINARGWIFMKNPTWHTLVSQEVSWNLLKDELSVQSEKTKAFIASLLPEWPELLTNSNL